MYARYKKFFLGKGLKTQVLRSRSLISRATPFKHIHNFDCMNVDGWQWDLWQYHPL